MENDATAPRPSNAFLHPDEPSIQDVIDRIGTDEALSATRRRDLCSSLRRLAKLLRRQPDQLPARVQGLKLGLQAVNAAASGISPKTLQNIRSDVLAAFRHLGISQSAKARLAHLRQDWRALHAALPTKQLKNGLSRLIHYCSAQNIDPAAVDDTVIADFMAAVGHHTFCTKPKLVHRNTTRFWNVAAKSVTGWPAQHLIVPDNRRPRTRLPLEAFVGSLARDVAAYLEMRGDPDPFDEHAPARSLKPNTLRLQRENIRLAANALLRRGRTIEDIGSLAVLVEPEAFKDILRQLLEDRDGKPTAFLEGVCKTLTAVAKLWVRVDQTTLDKLKWAVSRLPRRPQELTAKNLRMLRQFDDPENLRGLLELPEQLVHEANRTDPVTPRAAIKVQIALAIELLLCCPIRSHNLIALRLDRHVLRPGGDGGRVFICLEPDEVKNEERLDFELPDHLARLLDTYLDHFRPMLADAKCPFLFVNLHGAQKDQRTLAQQVKETINKRTGVVLTVHQFRHLAAKLHLEDNPGGFESLRQLLGHTSTKITVNAYAGLDTRTAAKLHDALIARRRRELQRGERRPRRRTK